ncbi:MAG: HipA domain-containing protein [Steroidobacteraceae bacterium]
MLEILEGSQSRDTDRENFVLAQLAFWLLAATDGHAKNFSIFHRVGGAFVCERFILGTGTTWLSEQDHGACGVA